MKKSPFITSIILSLMMASAFAKDDQLIVAEAEKNIFTIAQAAKAADETGVTVTGIISRHLQGEDYELKDATGTIKMEVDSDLATAQQLAVGTKVTVVAEVDTHRIKPTDLDVVYIQILK